MATKTTQLVEQAVAHQEELLKTDKTTSPAALAGDRVYATLDHTSATALRLVREQPGRYMGASDSTPSKGRALAYIIHLGSLAILTSRSRD